MSHHKELLKRGRRIILVLLAMAFFAILDSRPILAESPDTTWQYDYRYQCLESVDGETGPFIKLWEYRGSGASCRIPSEAVIGHRRYRTYIESVDLEDQQLGIWTFAENVEEIILEEGIRFGKDMSYVFKGSRARKIIFDHCDTSGVQSMKGMFSSCTGLVELKADLNTSDVVDMSEMFSWCSSLEELDLSSFHTSRVRDMENMFAACKALRKLDLSSFDTRAVTNMHGMFSSSFSSGHALDLTAFDTGQVTVMSSMFKGCCADLILTDPDRFLTSNVRDMQRMFASCRNLKTFDFSSFDTSGVTDMSCMFYGCTSWQKLDLSSFDTSHVVSMNKMFCLSRIRNLDISSLDFTEDPNTSEMLATAVVYTIRTPDHIPESIESITLCDDGYYDIHARTYYELPKNRKSMILQNGTFGEAFNCDRAVILAKAQYASGKALRPSFTVTLDGKKISELVYHVEYSDNVHVGKGRIKLTFDDFWCGTATGYFEIRQPARGKTFQKGNALYKVTKAGREVTFLGLVRKRVKLAVIPDIVVFEGVSYRVTGIKKKAFLGNSSVRKVIIGANVNRIGKKVFASCRNLKKVILNIRNRRDIMEAHLERMFSKSTNHGKKVKVSVKNKRARAALRKKRYRRMIVSKRYRRR